MIYYDTITSLFYSGSPIHPDFTRDTRRYCSQTLRMMVEIHVQHACRSLFFSERPRPRPTSNKFAAKFRCMTAS